jgi:hypothetical protein
LGDERKVRFLMTARVGQYIRRLPEGVHTSAPSRPIVVSLFLETDLPLSPPGRCASD